MEFTKEENEAILKLRQVWGIADNNRILEKEQREREYIKYKKVKAELVNNIEKVLDVIKVEGNIE